MGVQAHVWVRTCVWASGCGVWGGESTRTPNKGGAWPSNDNSHRMAPVNNFSASLPFSQVAADTLALPPDIHRSPRCRTSVTNWMPSSLKWLYSRASMPFLQRYSLCVRCVRACSMCACVCKRASRCACSHDACPPNNAPATMPSCCVLPNVCMVQVCQHRCGGFEFYTRGNPSPTGGLQA